MAKTTKTRNGVARNAPTKAVGKKKPAITKQIRRPDVNEGPSLGSVNQLVASLQTLKTEIESYAVHLRALDRRRLNGVGIKKQGFIEAAYELAVKSPEFLPHWLPTTKFQYDYRLFLALRSLYNINEQIGELVWNLVMQSSDMAYTDALEYYASVREAAKRRVDAAETVFGELMEFFKSRGRKPEDQPTEMEVKRDMNALLKGKKDGKVVVENFTPKLTGGDRKVIDKTYRTKADFKETAEGDLYC